MQKKYFYGKIEVQHSFMPGIELDELSFKKMHSALVMINENSGANVVNKMLDKNLKLEELKEHFTNTIVAIIFRDNRPLGFLISPILSSKNNLTKVIHSGLIVVDKNPGVDLISLLALGNFTMGYKNFGKFFTTNITSTPSIVESFSWLVPGTWPGPDANLKVAPKGFKEVVTLLKEDYMDKYFPNPEKLDVNLKRFTLTSNSQEMGFVTDLRKISRSDSFKYMSFCHAWLDYQKEEDLIQVGEINFWKHLRNHYLLMRLKKKLKGCESKIESSEQLKMEKGDKKVAA